MQSPYKIKLLQITTCTLSSAKLRSCSVFCVSKTCSGATNQRVFAQEVSKPPEFTQSFAGRAGSWGGGMRFMSRTELQKNVLKPGGSSFKRHKAMNPLAPLFARPAFVASCPCCSEGTLLLPHVWPRQDLVSPHTNKLNPPRVLQTCDDPPLLSGPTADSNPTPHGLWVGVTPSGSHVWQWSQGGGSLQGPDTGDRLSPQG